MRPVGNWLAERIKFSGTSNENKAICILRLESGDFQVQSGLVPRLELTSWVQSHFNFNWLELSMMWVWLFRGRKPTVMFRGSLTAADPKRPSRFPDSGRSAKPGAFELEFSEPAIGDLNLPANCGYRSLEKLTSTNGRLPIRYLPLAIARCQAVGRPIRSSSQRWEYDS